VTDPFPPENGCVTIRETSGLGVGVDREKLEEIATEIEEIRQLGEPGNSL